uniref:RING-type E3 ubiquitin transferase n=1 Tax=Branchiostoma floridae TaxID=7739 RepID=C3ZG92_BRAFL|eukprot:XP_002592402.1 hypothetical protein BRAFLDRAFT_67267 [Branchiostoma floridae]
MAAAPSSLGEQIREELSCSICLELVTRPKVLPCQHTFCQDCLQDHASRRVPFQCPNCRQQVRLPPRGVAGLPDSHLATSLCERLQNQATLSTREQSQYGNRCSFHPSEDVRLYCKQCKVPICHECFEKSHDEHPTMSLRRVIQQHRGPVLALISEGRGILETYCGFIRGLREEERRLDDQKQETDIKIMDTYRQARNQIYQIYQQLTEERNRLLSEVETNYKQNKEAVQSQRDAVLTDVAELSSACDGAKQDMTREDKEFLSRESKLDEIVGKFRGKTLPSPVQTHSAIFQPRVSVELACTLGVIAVPRPATRSDAAMGFMGHFAFGGEGPKPAYRGVMGHQHGNQKHTLAPVQTLTFGGEGPEPGQFSRPLGITVSEEGEIFVADMKNQRIQVFTLQSTLARHFPTVVPGEECRARKKKKNKDWSKMCPHNVAMDGKGRLWVVGNTEFAEFAVKYDKQGMALGTIKLTRTKQIIAIAVDTKRNHIFIPQITGERPNLNCEVLVLRPAMTVARTMGWGKGMKDPSNITVDGEGNILVSDCENDCVYVYAQDGQFLFKFGGEGSGEGQLQGPMGICTDKSGNIIVADRGNSRLEMFDKTGRFLKHIPVDIESPWGVAMAPQGQLVITDFDNHTVTIVQNI